MAARKRVPGYLLHKSRGIGKVIIQGKTHYLPGQYDSDESRAEYERFIADYLLKKDHPETLNVTINRLCVAFVEHAQAYYVKDGAVTAEVSAIRCSLRPLIELYGRQIVADFGPKKLILVRERMIERGLFRKTVNDSVKRIIRRCAEASCNSGFHQASWGPAANWKP